MRWKALFALVTLVTRPEGALAGEPWSIERSLDPASRVPVYEAIASDRVTGGRLMFRCAHGQVAVYVAMPDATNWSIEPGTRVSAYVQVGSGPTDTYPGTVHVKRDGVIVYDVEAPDLAGRLVDGEVRVMVPRNSERPVATFDTKDDATVLAPVRSCGR